MSGLANWRYIYFIANNKVRTKLFPGQVVPCTCTLLQKLSTTGPTTSQAPPQPPRSLQGSISDSPINIIMSSATNKKTSRRGVDDLVVQDELSDIESWVGPTDGEEPIESLEKRPARLGLGAKYIAHSQARVSLFSLELYTNAPLALCLVVSLLFCPGS